MGRSTSTTSKTTTATICWIETSNPTTQSKTQQLNQQIKGLNQNNQQLALSANQFNQTFQPRLFHKGQFNGKQISVYEFSSKDDLRMTLAHEFGHALGLDHTDDPTSLMYPVIQKQNMERFALAHADQQELVRAVN